MTHFNLKNRFLPLAGRAPLLAVALLVACSSSDQRPLVLVNVPVSDYPSAQTVVVDVVVQGFDTSQLMVDLTPGTAGATAGGHYGVYLTSGTSGNATVIVSVRDAAHCELASGNMPDVPVSPGQTSGPVIIPLTPSAVSCVPDAGPGPDTLPPPADVATPTEVGGPDLAAGVDGGPGDVLAGDAARPDGVLPDAGADVPIGADVAGDAPAPDVALPIDVEADGAADLLSGIDLPVADAEVGPTTMNVFRNCSSYVHAEIFSDGPGDWGVTQLVFTPDGQNLVSYGEDGRAKVWSVTETGLAELPSGLVFTGSGALYGGMSLDGKYLAIGDRNATVKVFDLQQSISNGAAVLQWTLLPQTILALPDAGDFYLDAAEVAVFTRDLNYLVVGYYGGGAPDPNLVAVWELGATPKVVQLVTLPLPERPWTGVTGSSATNAWIGTEGRFDTDAGDPQVALAVLDVSPTGVTRAEATASGYFYDMVFSPDGNSLAVGFTNGQALLYDVSDKATMSLQSPPLIPEQSAGMTDIYGMAFTLDGKYFAAGQYDLDSDTTSVKLLPVAQRPSQTVEKTTMYIPWSVAFAPNGLGLAVGERDDGVLLYCTP
jgi:hypothetical protein